MTTDVHDYAAMMEAQLRVREQLSEYDGNFQFLLEMQALAKDPDYVFSERQLEATIKSLIRHNNAKAGVTALVQAPLLGDAIPVGSTRHAVVNASGQLTFLRLDKIVDPEKKWNGWVFVKHILGPNELRIGAQRPDGSYKGQWPSLLEQINANPIESMSRYGQEIGQCGVCDLRLTDATSRKIGIGPICRDKVGI
jgi:hypothetical protein